MAKLLTVVKIGPEAEENRPVQAWKPWLGVSTQVLTRELSEALKMPKTTRGVRIAQVYPRTPAQKAGMLAGDLLFRIDGQIIQAYRTEDAEVFGNMIKEYKPGSLALFSGMREGKKLDLNVTLEKRPDPSNELPDYEEETLNLRFENYHLEIGSANDLRKKNPAWLWKMLNPQDGLPSRV